MYAVTVAIIFVSEITKIILSAVNAPLTDIISAILSALSIGVDDGRKIENGIT